MQAPKVSFTQPKHGKLSFMRTKRRIVAGKTCGGKLMGGISIYYRAKAGFRGRDTGKFGLSMARFVDGGGRTYRSYKLNLQVR